ncbi:MAG: hypothetical protein WC889_11115, partial [Myxococcota bacterium]
MKAGRQGGSRITLVHTPRTEFLGDTVARSFIMIMPVGLMGLADVLDRRGHEVEILHLGLRRMRTPRFDLGAHVAERRAQLVGFTLQWHHQLYNVLREAMAVKAAAPEASVVL